MHISVEQNFLIFPFYFSGYEEISTVRDGLNDLNIHNELVICQLHSQMASKEQKKAFKNYRAPLRKIILATNLGKCNNKSLDTT